MLAVFADPVFEKDDERVTKIAVRTESAKPPTTAETRQTRLLKHASDQFAGRIPRLPFTRREADSILALVPEADARSALGFTANRASVSAADLSRYRYIHFATHGILNSQNPELSSIVLSLVDESGTPQDGFLRAMEVYNLNLPAEAVVLSACETGLGKQVKGEGLVGLTRGFMYAGTPRVIVSLWAVNDRATAELMTRLYRKMLKENLPPAAALRAAQTEMFRDTQWKSPYYWAAFAAQGEWR
jgi:CHAT domain-containing protein